MVDINAICDSAGLFGEMREKYARMRKAHEEREKTNPRVYNCDICKDTGVVNFAVIGGEKVYVKPSEVALKSITTNVHSESCKCRLAKEALERLELSGLKNQVTRCTFENYNAAEPWQKRIKEIAIGYAENPNSWFYLGGQNGSGKTHLCAAIFKRMIDKMSAVYMPWVDVSRELKRVINDSHAYHMQAHRYFHCQFLYIDDFFFGDRRDKSGMWGITPADIGLAEEIIDFRYRNKKLTMISSELLEEELYSVNKAIGGRIYEMCNDGELFKTIEFKEGRDYRMRKAEVI